MFWTINQEMTYEDHVDTAPMHGYWGAVNININNFLF